MIGPSVNSKLQSLNLGLSQPNGTQRIYPNYVKMIDKSVESQLVYSCENYQPEAGLDGPTGSAQIDVKIIAVAQTYDDADALGNAVAAALDGTRGTWGSLVVQGCFVDEVSEDHFVDTDLETILYYVKEITFKVMFITPA
jgi:hypothetical protein